MAARNADSGKDHCAGLRVFLFFKMVISFFCVLLEFSLKKQEIFHIALKRNL